MVQFLPQEDGDLADLVRRGLGRARRDLTLKVAGVLRQFIRPNLALQPAVWSIGIIPVLARRTRALYDSLIGRGYSEYHAIRTRNADGYYEERAIRKIIVTSGIDHIPPPLLQQLVPDRIMVIPVGPPSAQHVLKAVKRQSPNGQMSVARSDIYGGAIIPLRAVHRVLPVIKPGRVSA